jgi:PAS domain S-box-containing protein
MPPSADNDELPPSEERLTTNRDRDASAQARVVQLEAEVRELRETLERKEAGRAACEKRYRLLFDHLIGAYVVCKVFYDEAGNAMDYVHLEINKAFEDLIGLKDPVGKRASELMPNLRMTNPEVFEIYGRVAKTGTPERLETFVPALSRWFEISVYCPEPEHFVAIVNNITPRKEVEEALRRSVRIYRAIGESLDYGIWICAPDGRNIYASQAFLELVGITQEECSNFGWGNILHPDDGERTIAAWKECVQTEGTWDMEHRYRRKSDGVYHPILARGVPVRNELGEIECWAGINLDISRQKATEERLRTNERRLSLLAHAASLLLVAENPLEVVNDLANRVMNHVDATLFVNFVTDPVTEAVELKAWSGIEEPSARELESFDFSLVTRRSRASQMHSVVVDAQRHPTKEGAVVLKRLGLHAYCTHPVVANDRLMGTLSFGTRNPAGFDADDVELLRFVAEQISTAVQRHLVLQELSRANAQLREADQQKSHFLAVLSHELRNPLTPIRNSLYVLERAVPGSTQEERAKEILFRQVNQLARLVDDLLDATRLARGKLRLEKQRIDLGSVVQHTVQDHLRQFEAAGITMAVSVPHEASLWLDGDGERLAQALGNLLSNAAKFTPRGGKVTLSLEHKAGNMAVIRVSDTGIGIAPDFIHRLFEPFVQADSSLDRSNGGLGLGLALVKGVVEAHGGTVAVQSGGHGTGSVFVLRLPVAPWDTHETTAVTSSAPPPKRRILIIEDNVDAADTLRDLLELGGHHVDVAYSGTEGVAKAKATRPELVLCDIGLPGFDGYSVARTLRQDPALSSTRLVAVSGYTQPRDLLLGREAGFDDHIAKPVTLERLEAVLGER